MEFEDRHTFDEDGEHDENECEQCVEAQESVVNSCKCGECCRSLIIEVSLRDAEREPKIKELGRPLKGMDGGLAGYSLNRKGKDYSCVFLNQDNLCGIYPTRPLVCRVFNCDGEYREELIELGILKRDQS